MAKKQHHIGTMLFEDFNKLSYEEQGKYIESLKPSINENDNGGEIQYTQIEGTLEEYVTEHNLVSFEELKERINNITNNTIDNDTD